MTLENIFKDVEVLEAGTGNQAIDVIKSNTDLNLIISDYNMPDGKGDVVYHYLQAEKLSIPYFLLTSDELETLPFFANHKEDDPRHAYFMKPVSLDEIESAVIDVVNLGHGEEISIDDFKKIRIINFLRFEKTLSDIYIKLSDRKVVKIISADYEYSVDDIKKYIDKGISHLYVKKSDFERYKTAVSATPFLVNLSHDSCDLNKSWNKILVGVTQLANEFGISKTVLEVSSRLVDDVLKDMKQRPFFHEKLLFTIKHAPLSAERSYLIAVLSCGILKNMDNHFAANFTKIVESAIFHDLFVSDWTISRIRNVQSATFLNLSYAQKRVVLEHPDLSAKSIEKSKNADKDVLEIIRQHHERPYGGGFPRGLKTNTLNSLAKVFIVAHDFVDRMYDFEFEQSSKQRILSEITQLFNENAFSEIIMALKRTLEGR